ncbi:MAG: hypothetical protein KA715_04575 [Xanthomonadaceae bacterium]|nr:hypothetical protein [Xanthomonadaceae bacterium]
MIQNEHYPRSIRFYEEGQITLIETDNLTPQDLYLELLDYNVLGFKVFDMNDPVSVNSQYGYFYYANTLDTDLAKEIGNVVMSQIASQIEDRFITAPVELKTTSTLEILLEKNTSIIQRFTFSTNEEIHRMVFCTFNSPTGLSGNA